MRLNANENLKEQTTGAGYGSPHRGERKMEDLITSEEAAKILGLKSKHTLEVWRSTNRYPELRYVKIGRAARYRRSDVEKFITKNVVGNVSLKTEDEFLSALKYVREAILSDSRYIADPTLFAVFNKVSEAIRACEKSA